MEEVAAHCGRCGQRFPLAALVADAAALGRCPLCQEQLLGDYAAVALPLVRELLDAAARGRRAAGTLAELGTALRLDPVGLVPQGTA